MRPRVNQAGTHGANVAERTVAKKAAAVVLALPEARGNGALPSLTSYLAFEAPMVDALPFMFLPEGAADPNLLERASCLAVAGRLLVARVRWLDEMVDAGVQSGTPDEVHILSAAVHEAALSRFAACLNEGQEAAEFFGNLAALEARYAASLAIDAASCRGPSANLSSARMELGAYAEQAKARAMVASAPVEAQMIATETGKAERRQARECMSALAVAWQLGDDVLDLEEDYREGGLSWIVSETISRLPEGEPLPNSDAFYEAALLGGHVHRALKESLHYYNEAVRAAGNLFPGARCFARGEAEKTAAMLADLTAIVSPSAQD